jgi:hypothetical protein
MSEALSKARTLRENIDRLTREIEKAGASGDRNRLREQAVRELQQTRVTTSCDARIPACQRRPRSRSKARDSRFPPGTEGFKQDFAK